MTSPLLVKPTRNSRTLHDITPRSAGWTYCGLRVLRLEAGQDAGDRDADRETCIVFLSGRGRVGADSTELGEIGGRAGPFAGPPWAAYVPAGSEWAVRATTEAEIAICSAPSTGGKHPARIIEVPPQFERGTGSNLRLVTNILPETDLGAEALLVVEVITPAGHSSSYPPHRHDTDNLPHESQLEEIYYHRINPPQGFAFQRVYSDDRSLDEAMAVEDGDAVLVPRGYHPCVAPHGYDLYYLNVMAGPKRVWKFHNDPAHEWMLR